MPNHLGIEKVASGVSPGGRRRFLVVRRGCPGVVGRARPRGPQRPTAFFDRDGVLNIDHGYVSKRHDWEWTPGALRALRYLKRNGFRLIVVTNQSGIGRGLYTEADLLDLTDHLVSKSPIDAVYYCPHHPDDNCPARKPGTSMLEAAAQDWQIDKSRSFLIGDRDTDLEAARRFGIPGHLYAGGDLFRFVQEILRPKHPDQLGD